MWEIDNCNNYFDGNCVRTARGQPSDHQLYAQYLSDYSTFFSLFFSFKYNYCRDIMNQNIFQCHMKKINNIISVNGALPALFSVLAATLQCSPASVFLTLASFIMMLEHHTDVFARFIPSSWKNLLPHAAMCAHLEDCCGAFMPRRNIQ